MPSDERTRPAPRVVRVPPPDGEVVSTRVLRAIAIALGVVALILAAFVSGVPSAITAFGALATAAFLAWLPRAVNTRYRRKRAEFLAALKITEPDPLAVAVAARWTRPSKTPKPDEIRAALRKAEHSDLGRAYVVCLGMVAVPEVDDVFFEPEIITPTRALGNHLWFIPPAFAILALWSLQLMGVIPGRAINIGGFGYILAMGVSAGVLWVWRSAIRPTYIRMAPGVVQILHYRYGRGKPVIRDYPLIAGTLVLVRGQTASHKPGHLTLTLLRGEQKDTLELWRMRKRNAIVERAWQALLSAAPTPPLSDEELVG